MMSKIFFPSEEWVKQLENELNTSDAYAEAARQRWGVPGMAVAVAQSGGTTLATTARAANAPPLVPVRSCR
jgi:hypothetical protein